MTRWRTLSSTSALATVLIGASLGLIPMQQLPKATAATVEGFGSMTKGGSGQPVCHVTHLQDHGIGSLRDAVAKGDRFIVFDVAGELKLASDMYVQGRSSLLTERLLQRLGSPCVIMAC